MSERILLVEDDDNLGFVIKDSLSLAGFEVWLCKNGEEGLSVFNSANFSLCVLDVMLPKMDGFNLAVSIRKQNDEIPIIFLTAKSLQEDKLSGFQTGADDYITKPFNMEELIYRIKVFLRRSSMDIKHTDSTFTLGQYEFDYNNLTLSINGDKKILTQKEADVLRYFCLNKEIVLKREDILTAVWGDDDYFLGRSMDVFISKLRKYLSADKSVTISNRHGIGFELKISETQS